MHRLELIIKQENNFWYIKKVFRPDNKYIYYELYGKSIDYGPYSSECKCIGMKADGEIFVIN